ncbi:MAG: hypothetical protein Q8O75_03460, partial [bacterium]|nr:hypothetical protein [bacterium]
YLKAKGYCLPESFCRFPSVILDTICVEPEVIAWQKTVYDHLDHDPHPQTLYPLIPLSCDRNLMVIGKK